MSLPQPPGPAKLVIGLFMMEKDLLEPLVHDLVEKIDTIDIVSPWFPFDYTSYYESEMGNPLFRRMLVFKSLIKQTDLPEIKRITNKLELEYSKNDKRKVNIDPGYLLLERFVLATNKNFTHRICISNGIYADLTLIFQKGEFKPLAWTYPDYAAQNMIEFLLKVREKLKLDLQKTSG